ncbi:hypothetical protein [Rhizobacter fulvus]
MIAQQSTEAGLRSQELSIRKQELDYQSKHASDILGAQERDREAVRTHARKVGRDKLIFAGIGLVALLAFAIWGLTMNKDAVVKEILQMVISAGLGAAGGFGAGRLGKKSADKEEQ